MDADADAVPASGSTSGGPSLTANQSAMSRMYREMRAVPLSDRVEVRRSAIHGWGLFLKRPVEAHGIVVEYVGEEVRQAVADEREKM